MVFRDILIQSEFQKGSGDVTYMSQRALRVTNFSLMLTLSYTIFIIKKICAKSIFLPIQQEHIVEKKIMGE